MRATSTPMRMRGGGRRRKRGAEFRTSMAVSAVAAYRAWAGRCFTRPPHLWRRKLVASDRRRDELAPCAASAVPAAPGGAAARRRNAAAAVGVSCAARARTRGGRRRAGRRGARGARRLLAPARHGRPAAAAAPPATRGSSASPRPSQRGAVSTRHGRCEGGAPTLRRRRHGPLVMQGGSSDPAPISPESRGAPVAVAAGCRAWCGRGCVLGGGRGTGRSAARGCRNGVSAGLRFHGLSRIQFYGLSLACAPARHADGRQAPYRAPHSTTARP